MSPNPLWSLSSDSGDATDCMITLTAVGIIVGWVGVDPTWLVGYNHISPGALALHPDKTHNKIILFQERSSKKQFNNPAAQGINNQGPVSYLSKKSQLCT